MVRALTPDLFNVPENVYFVAACNPYQFKRISEKNKNEIVRVHPSKQNLLSHKVLPITPNLLFKIFDYGALTSEIEKRYIRNIFEDMTLKASKKVDNISEKFIPLLCEFVCEGQQAMKKFFNSQSAVSLRDVNRVKEVFLFYLHMLQFERYYQADESMSFKQFRVRNPLDLLQISEAQFLCALSVTMHLNYIFRLGLTGRV